jgi:glycerophosphoryl diester phosphodiesterase
MACRPAAGQRQRAAATMPVASLLRGAIGALLGVAASVTLALATSSARPVKPLAAKVLVIAHRGASALRPEHTLAAYSQAIADGADFIEPDLVATRDGVLVARHENEISGTTDVATHAEFAERRTRKQVDGVEVDGWFTEDFSLAELKTLRARERLPDIRGTHYDGDYPVATFDEIIDLVAAEAGAHKRTVGIIPELKHSTYFAQRGLALEDRLLAALDAHEYTHHAPVEIQSFEISNLRYLRGKLGHAHANVRLLQLLDEPQQRPYDEVIARSDTTYAQMMTPQGLREIAHYADAIGPWSRSIIALGADGTLGTPGTLVRDAHAAGLEVHTYTFRPENRFLPTNLRDARGDNARNDAGSIAEIRAYLDAGIDAFFTDDPALGRRALARDAR